jgi:hypothetical protein
MSNEKLHIDKITNGTKSYVNVEYIGEDKVLTSMIYTAMHGNAKLRNAILHAVSEFGMDIIREEEKARLN